MVIGIGLASAMASWLLAEDSGQRNRDHSAKAVSQSGPSPIDPSGVVSAALAVLAARPEMPAVLAAHVHAGHDLALAQPVRHRQYAVDAIMAPSDSLVDALNVSGCAGRCRTAS